MPMTDERCLDCEMSWAVRDGDPAALQAAILQGADPGSDSDCNTALFDAIDEGLLDIFAALLDAGADPLRRHPLTDQTPLMAALEGEQADMVRELIARGVDPASAPLAALVHGEDRPEVVRLALSGGVDLDTADPETGKTALHVAAMYGYWRTARRLIEEGADTEVRDKWGNTPATLAVRNHHHEVARLLADVSDEQR